MGKKYRSQPLANNDPSTAARSMVLPDKVIHPRTASQPDRPPIAKKTLSEVFAHGDEASSSKPEEVHESASFVSEVEIQLDEDNNSQNGTASEQKIKLSAAQRRRAARKIHKSKSVDTPESAERPGSKNDDHSIGSDFSTGSSNKAPETGDASKPPKSPSSSKKKSKTTTVSFDVRQNGSTSDLRLPSINSDLSAEGHSQQLESQLALQGKLQELQNQVAIKDEELQKKSKELEAALENCRPGVFANYKKDLEDNQAKIASYENRVKTPEASLESKGDTETKLRNVLSQLDDFQKKCKETEQKKEQLDRENQNLKSDLEKVRAAESSVLKENNELKAKLAQVEKYTGSEMEALRRTLSETQAQLQVNVSMIPEMDRLRKELEEAEKKVAASAVLASEFDALRLEVGAVKPSKETEELKTKLKEKEAELDGAKIKLQQIEEIKRRNAALEAKLEKLDKLTQQVELLTESRALQEKKLNEFLEYNDKLKKVNEELRLKLKKTENVDNGYHSTLSSRSSPERVQTQSVAKKVTEINVVSSDLQVSRLSDVFGKPSSDTIESTAGNESPKKEAVTLAHIVDVEAGPERIEEKLRQSANGDAGLDSFGMPGFESPRRSVDSAKKPDVIYTEVFVKPNESAVEPTNLVPLIEPDVNGISSEVGLANGNGKAGSVAPEVAVRPKKRGCCTIM